MSSDAQRFAGRLLNAQVVRHLRAIGFKGTAGTLYKAVNDGWVLVALSRRSSSPFVGRESSPGAVLVTADLGVSLGALAALDGFASDVPPPRWAWNRETRLGPLTGRGYDHWWALDPASPEAAQEEAIDLREALLNEGIPAMEPLTDAQALQDLWVLEASRLVPHERVWLGHLLSSHGPAPQP
jgi:hypothetical protein